MQNQFQSSKGRNFAGGQSRTAQATTLGGLGGYQGLRSPGASGGAGATGSGYRVKTNKNSEEPRSAGDGSIGLAASTTLTAGRRIQQFHIDDPESDKQHKLRVKKKLLMSDSLQMLTKQRNKYLHHSINKSIQSKNNSQKSNQSRERRDDVANQMYGRLTGERLQTITMHNSMGESTSNLYDTQNTQ